VVDRTLIDKLRIRNFKSIEEGDLDLCPITLIVGPNGSGKSSVIQALGVLKNFILNSNRSEEELYNLGYIRLGGHSEVAWQHQADRTISIMASITTQNLAAEFTIELGAVSSSKLRSPKPIPSLQTVVKFTLPYAQNQQAKSVVNMAGRGQWVFVWNGITMSLESPAGSHDKAFEDLTTLHTNAILSIFIVPTAGAFYNTIYSIVGVPDKRTLLTIPENVIPAIFQQDADLEERTSTYMEEIFDVRSVRAKIAYPNASIMVGRRRLASNIVNEGMGLNRIAFLLATILMTPRGSLIAVEEPENHLHPQAQARLADRLVHVVKNERKQLLITTHSEHLLLAFLSAIGRGELTPKDVAIYFSTLNPNDMRSTFERAIVNEKGQVKGGLKGFFETDVEALSDALKNLSGK
jgi:predicted ATPase